MGESLDAAAHGGEGLNVEVDFDTDDRVGGALQTSDINKGW